MGTFAYIVRDRDGRRLEGKLSGASLQAVTAELHSRQWSPIEVREEREHRLTRRGVSQRQLAGAYQQIADLLRAGVPLLRALRLLGRSKANPRLASVMNTVADAVSDGGRLADAMAEHEDVFPSVQIAMIRAGERGGFLEEVLERMGSFIEHQAELKSKVIGNLIYPIILLFVGVGVIVFALTFLVPQFSGFFPDPSMLPLPTRMLLGASEFLQSQWHIVLIAVAVLVAAALWLRRQPTVRRALARWQLRIPKLGVLARDLAVGRFARILGTMLENGIPMLPAMQISRDATGHILLQDAIDEAIESVRAGETLTDPLAKSGMLSDEVVEMISVGESANNLPAVLVKLADTIEKRVDRMLTALVRMMEPLLLLGMGGVVFFIFMALVVPMLRLSSSMQ